MFRVINSETFFSFKFLSLYSESNAKSAVAKMYAVFTDEEGKLLEEASLNIADIAAYLNENHKLKNTLRIYGERIELKCMEERLHSHCTAPRM